MRSSASRIFVLFSASVLFISAACAGAAPVRASSRVAEAHSPPVAAVRQAVARLQQWYDPKSGLWKTTGWWNSANALTTLIDYSRVTHSSRYKPVIEQTYKVNIHNAFLNNYYDDEGWWALAWIDAYDMTGRQRYLQAARNIFANMTGGWDNTCGGGIWWSKKRAYKNAIANELFLSVAAHLANRASTKKQREAYATWAKREWHWFRHSGMIERNHLISDGLTSACKDNHKTQWTYNQGVILGGLIELSRQEQSRSPLRAAHRIAAAAIDHLTGKEGILHEPCEPNCGADGSQFKGIFVRNLALLYDFVPRKKFRRFILRNADSILRNDQTPTHALGLLWSGPPGKPNASTQSSALDALVAALDISQKEAH